MDYFVHGRVDGLIAFGSRLADGNVFKEITQKAKHFVLIEGDIPDYEYNRIQIDNIGGAYRATKHLLERGYRKVCHVTGDLSYSAALDRMNGFIKAMCDFNAAVTGDNFVHADSGEELACRRIDSLIRDRRMPDAFFVGEDKTAYGVIRALFQNGIRVPEDVAVIGFDGDNPDSCDMLFPKLTSMRQPLYKMGKAGVELLVRSIQNPGLKPEKIVFEPEFIIGQTCP